MKQEILNCLSAYRIYIIPKQPTPDAILSRGELDMLFEYYHDLRKQLYAAHRYDESYIILLLNENRDIRRLDLNDTSNKKYCKMLQDNLSLIDVYRKSINDRCEQLEKINSLIRKIEANEDINLKDPGIENTLREVKRMKHIK